MISTGVGVDDDATQRAIGDGMSGGWRRDSRATTTEIIEASTADDIASAMTGRLK
jgi:hypothetical protein